MLEEWRSRAACRGLSPEIFYEEVEEGSDNHGAAAKAVCSTCEVQMECLAYSIENNERFGIWGGIGDDRRARLRAIYRRGSALEFERAIVEEVEATARWIGAIEDERPIDPERPCGRCDSTIPEGRHPPDRNGPGATCGKAATYNKGCRCLLCVKVKSEYGREGRRRRALRETPPPRGGLVCTHDNPEQ